MPSQQESIKKALAKIDEMNTMIDLSAFAASLEDSVRKNRRVAMAIYGRMQAISAQGRR